MKPTSIEAIARTILYEGYMLYPYRPSALKNRLRWNFGVLFPPAFCNEQDRSEHSFMQTECLLEAEIQTSVEVQLRFLQQDNEGTVERLVHAPSIPLAKICAEPKTIDFCFPPLEGLLSISASRLAPAVWKLTVTATNVSCFKGKSREAALRVAMLSTNKILRLERGQFFSQTDPPNQLRPFLQHCRNFGAWPVLAGDERARDTMLSSPIILYDFPKVAPQSAGDLFDATEIDELLRLRILTLTDAEKAEMRHTDLQTQQLLEQTESIAPEDLQALHGAVSRENPSAISFQRGDRVRVHPQARADIFDVVLAGKTAVVLSVEQDFENRDFVCVAFEDDPGCDLGDDGKPGHRFFFRPEELKRL
ncbi:MAG: hypothetical protein AB1813_18165 [Verrucomicrobiota bacterium]